MRKRNGGIGLFVPSLFAAAFLLSPWGGLFPFDLTALAADTQLGGHLNASNYGIYNISGLGIGTDSATPGALCFASGCQTVPYGGGTQQTNAANVMSGGFGTSYDGLHSSGNYWFRPATDSTGFLQVLSSGGSPVFDVDTSNQRVGIETANPGYTLDVNGIIQANATFRTPSVALSETSRRAKDASNVNIETVYGWQGNSGGKTFLQIWGFAPPTMYRTTGDLPAPYGIGFGNGSESGGIMPIGQGDNLQEIMFYGSNSGPTTFTWKHQVWESSTYDPSNSNYYSAPAMSLNANTGQLYVAGNVGIGNASPGYKLDVSGGVHVSTGNSFYTTGPGNASLSDTAGNNFIRPLDQYSNFYVHVGTGGYYEDAANHYIRNASGGNAVTIDSSGNITLPGVVTATGGFSGNYTGTVGAANVWAGSFGANTGGGDYAFPAKVTAATICIGSSCNSSGWYSAGTGLVLSGTTFGVGTQTWDDITQRAPSSAGYGSGFYQTSAASPSYGWPAGASSWWHLINDQHTNVANNYALQIAGSFYDQNLYFRKTNNSGTQAWSKFVAVDGSGNVSLPGPGIWNSSGNVGIKTSNPTYPLTIIGQSDTGNSAFAILGSSTNAPMIELLQRADGTTNAGVITMYAGNPAVQKVNITAGTGNTYFNGSGNVGIGLTSPTQKLDVSGNIKTSGWIAAGGTTPGGNGGTSGYGINLPSTTNDSVRIIGEHDGNDTSNGVFATSDNTNDGWYFRESDCCGGGVLDYMRIARNLVYYVGEGNFGVGTASPGYKLDVSGNTRITGGLVMNYVNNGTLSVGGGSIGGNDAVGYFEDQSNNDWGIRINKGTYDYGLKVEVGSGASYAFQILGSGTEKVRIDGSGNAWFGGTINAGGFGGNYTGTIGAANVWAGSFGANTGGGSYTFPSNLTVNGNIYESAGDNSYTVYGPNSSWGGYLVVGATPSRVASGMAQAISTNGNLHLDSGTGQRVYIQYYSGQDTYINSNGGNVGIGNTGPSYKLDVSGDIHATGWVRTDGTQGWYSDTYQGGWYMQDTSWIRTYNSKSVWTDTGLLGSNGGLTVGYGGAAPPSNGAIIAGNVGIGSNGAPTKLFVNGTTRITGDSEIDGGSTLYFGKEESFGGSDIGGSDYGYIRWDNDNNTYAFWGDSTENGALVIGSQNDGPNSVSDVVALQSDAAVIVNAPYFIMTDGVDRNTITFMQGGDLSISGTVHTNIVSNSITTNSFQMNGTLTAGGNIVVSGSSGYSIYDWTSTDANWRIGMSNDNAVVGFTRALATSHVQYLTFSSGAGQGFAVGDKVSGLSSFEVTGSGSSYKAYFRGSVGIGNTNPVATLDVNGMVRATSAMSPSSGVGAELQWTGYASQLQSYNRSTSAYQPLELKASSISTNASMTIGGGSKLTVNTVDPVYTIGGEKYATYGSESVGVTVDLKGTAEVLAPNCGKDGICSYVMDIGGAEKNSDLWLFAQTTNLKDNFDKMMVILTQAFDGEVWYEKDAQAMTVTIYAKPSVKYQIPNTKYEVSYHLSAPRFDAAEWPNTSTDNFEGLNLDKWGK